MTLKLHDERMNAVQEEFDLHPESYQRDVTASMTGISRRRFGAAEGTEERILALRTEQLR